MDFTERLELYKDANMIQDKDVQDIESVIQMFQKEYGVTLEEENAGTFIAHLCAAYGRNTTKEEVPPLAKENLEEIAKLPSYDRSVEILNRIIAVTKNPLNEVEKGYVLLHLNNLIMQLTSSQQWTKDSFTFE